MISVFRTLKDNMRQIIWTKSDISKKTWLEPYKEKLVKAWVNQHLHFGNVVTSRVEGIHSLLKSYLKKSTLDLFDAWKAIKHALLNQLAELKSNQAIQQLRIPVEFLKFLYSAVHSWISYEALRRVEEQRKLLVNNNLPLPPPPCLVVPARSLDLKGFRVSIRSRL